MCSSCFVDVAFAIKRHQQPANKWRRDVGGVNVSALPFRWGVLGIVLTFLVR